MHEETSSSSCLWFSSGHLHHLALSCAGGEWPGLTARPSPSFPIPKVQDRAVLLWMLGCLVYDCSYGIAMVLSMACYGLWCNYGILWFVHRFYLN